MRHQAYFVGGCVRDLLLDKPPKDFDIATDAHPGEVRAIFRNCRLIGRRFRLAHVYFRGGKVIEVATFRKNPVDVGEDLGAEGDLLITRDNVFGTAEEDAVRRDFTVNGLFYDPATGEVIDYVGGRADLEAHRIATIGDPEVRMRAIRLLDEADDAKLIPAFIRIMDDDPDPETRAEAASALGKFVELGELEEIADESRQEVEGALLEKANSEDQGLVRRHALESLGFSSRPEVITLIESSFRRENPEWQASALFAMGRSFDERWEESILSRMMDVNSLVRLAAVEAAGELRLASARTVLFRVLEEEEEDNITSAAIWSLSQIGGEDVRLYIENLLDLAEEDEDVEFLDEALDNVEFTDELNQFDLLSIDPDEEE